MKKLIDFNNRRGLSQIVTVLMFILLALVAVGVIWTVVGGIVERGTENIDYTARCLEIDVKITTTDCDDATGVCSVVFTRNAGGDEIGGVKLIFSNVTGVNFVHDVPGDVQVLDATIESGISTSISNINNIEITPYLLDNIGNEQICTI